MSGILSQDEIDALLKDVPGGGINTGMERDDGSAAFEPYDLTEQERGIKDPTPAMNVICEKFSKNYRSYMSNLLRKNVDVIMSSRKSLKFWDIIPTFPLPASFHIFKMNSLTGSGLLVFQPDLIFAVIDILFGGKGSRAKIEGREFTAIEIRMINRLRDAVLKNFEQSWSTIHKANCRIMRSELNPQLASASLQDDLACAIDYELAIEGITGKLTICLAYSMLEPIGERLRIGAGGEEEAGNKWRQKWQQVLMDVPVNIVAELGSTFLSCQELLDLNKGDVLMLEKSTEEALEMKVEGVIKFKGYPGTYKDLLAIQVAPFTDGR